MSRQITLKQNIHKHQENGITVLIAVAGQTVSEDLIKRLGYDVKEVGVEAKAIKEAEVEDKAVKPAATKSRTKTQE